MSLSLGTNDDTITALAYRVVFLRRQDKDEARLLNIDVKVDLVSHELECEIVPFSASCHSDPQAADVAGGYRR